MKGVKNSVDEVEVSGYVVSIMPRTSRGLLEYKVKIMTPGGKSETMYAHEPKIPLRPGIPVKVRAILSRQSEEPKLVIESMEPLKGLKTVEPTLVSIEKIARGAYLIVSGKSGEKSFSIPVEEELVQKIPENLPQEVYCIFIEQGCQIVLAEILRKKEHEIFLKIMDFLPELNQEESESEKVVDEYLKNAKSPYMEAVI